MENTKIEWAHHTFDPWEGCVQVSPECDHCYAAARDVRFHLGANWGKDALRLFHAEAYWSAPRRWNQKAQADGDRRRVFCGPLCDIMEIRNGVIGERMDATRLRLWRMIEETLWLDWLLVTKRPQNFRKLLPQKWLRRMPSNVWGIVTVGLQSSAWRIGELAKLPFTVRGISAEPLLGPLDLTNDLRLLDWVIAGGESGPGARPSHPQWFRDLRDQCLASHVPFFFKQWGEYHGGLLVGKRAAGRELDGRTWDKVPIPAIGTVGVIE